MDHDTIIILSTALYSSECLVQFVVVMLCLFYVGNTWYVYCIVVLYCIVLYFIVSPRIALYCIVLYCIWWIACLEIACVTPKPSCYVSQSTSMAAFHQGLEFNRLGETGASCYGGRLLQGHFMQNYYHLVTLCRRVASDYWRQPWQLLCIPLYLWHIVSWCWWWLRSNTPWVCLAIFV